MAELIPQAELGGDDMDALLAQLDEDEGGRIKRRKWTVGEALADIGVERRQEVADISSKVISGPPSRQKRSTRFMLDYMEYTAETDSERTEKRVGGREKAQSGFIATVIDFLTVLVHRSAKVDGDLRPILDEDGRPMRMSVGALVQLRSLCFTLLALFPVPSLSVAVAMNARMQLHRHCEVLVKSYHLKIPQRQRAVLYADDVRALIEIAFETAAGLFDWTVQLAVMMLLFFYTGARPGAMLKNRHYPDEFLLWKDIRFRLEKDADGHPIGWTVMVTLRFFKGFHQLKNLTVTFQIRPTVSDKYILLDLGTALIAHGLRQGVFGDRTLDQILASDRYEFGVDREYEKRPVFVGRGSRTALGSQPLDDKKANYALANLMKLLGIHNGARYTQTLYSFRRGFATSVSRHLDKSLAKFYMGHFANSGVLEATYYAGYKDENMTEGLLGPNDHRAQVLTPLTYKRARDAKAIPVKVTMEDALKVHPQFRHLAVKRSVLKRCLASGSSHWQSMEPWKSTSMKATLSQACLPVLIARYTKKLEIIIDQLRTSKYESLLEQQAAEVDETSWETIEAARKAAEQPTELIQQLQNRLLAEEAKIVEDSTVVIPAPQNMIIDVTAADDIDLRPREEQGETSEDEGGEPEAGPAEEMEASGNEGEDLGTETEGEEQALMVASQNVAVPPEVAARLRELEARDIQPQGPSHVSNEGQLLFPKQSLLDKFVYLRSLVDIRDASKPSPCATCASDATLDITWKEKVWVQGFDKKMHDLQVHDPFPRANRFLRACIQNDVSWDCPFCEMSVQSKNNRARVEKQGRLHLANNHRDRIPGEFVPCFEEATRNAQKQLLAQKIKDLPQGGTRQKARAGEAGGTPALHFDYFPPGMIEPEDLADPYTASLGLGPSIHQTRFLDFGLDKIPEGLLDEEGFVKRLGNAI